MCSNINVDIIIVGGGISGLVAAYDILKHEPTLKVIVLEAKDRIGGRTLTVPMKVNSEEVCPVDLGGHWISSDQVLLLQLLDTLDLNIVPQYKMGKAIADVGYNKIYTFEGHPIIGNMYSKYELRNFYAKLEMLSEVFKCSTTGPSTNGQLAYDTLSMEDYIKSKLFTNVARNIARMLIRTTCGIEPSQISLLCYMVYCNGSLGFTNQYMTSDGGAREYWILEGAQEICNRLASKLDKETLITNSPVLKIKHSDKQITVETCSSNYTCEYIIVAIPPGEITKIHFEPSLCAERYAILLHTRCEHLIKFAISYKEFFWREDGFSGEIFNCGEGPIHVCYDATNDNNPMLIGYIFQHNTQQQICYKDKVINQLVKYWGEKAKDPIHYVEKNWFNENYTGSCPTARPIMSCMKYCYKLSEPLGRIYWAGTETANVWTGYMEGAVQAGHRASLDVLYHLRPQSLTFTDMIYNEYYRYKKVHRKRLIQKWYIVVDDPIIYPLMMGAALFGLFLIYNRYF